METPGGPWRIQTGIISFSFQAVTVKASSCAQGNETKWAFSQREGKKIK